MRTLTTHRTERGDGRTVSVYCLDGIAIAYQVEGQPMRRSADYTPATFVAMANRVLSPRTRPRGLPRV